MNVDEQVELLGHLTRVAAAIARDAPLAERLCRALVEILDLDGASMTIGYSAPVRTTLCATDSLAEQIEELQDVLREGPGLDAHRLRRAISVTAAEAGAHWPMLTQALAAQGDVPQLIAVPMKPDSRVLGVVTSYRRTYAVTADDLARLQFLANAIGVAVLGGFEREEDTNDVWSTRDLVNQATGMVVAQLRIEPSDALAVLRAHAFAHDTSLAGVAVQVIDRDLDFHRNATRGNADAMDDEPDDH